MPFTQITAISFGLVYISAALYPATQDDEARFSQRTRDGRKRVRYVKTCPGCKQAVVRPREPMGALQQGLARQREEAPSKRAKTGI